MADHGKYSAVWYEQQNNLRLSKRILELEGQLRKCRKRQPRQQQNVERDTAIVNMRDKDKMKFKDIGRGYGITPARVRQLYIRRKLQQEQYRQKVHRQTNLSQFLKVTTGPPSRGKGGV